jgi:hypothetical protein
LRGPALVLLSDEEERLVVEGIQIMRRLRAFVAVALLLAFLLSAGCYTVLRHPVAESVTQGDTYYRSCADCHADAAYYHPYYSYGSSHSRWSSYYGYPWWYDDYWWWYPHEETGEPRDVERGERHLWGSGGWASGGWGFSKRVSTTPAPPPPADPGDDQDKDDPKEQKKPEEDSKDDRNLWKKPKKGF